jgi:hypothetical protein
MCSGCLWYMGPELAYFAVCPIVTLCGTLLVASARTLEEKHVQPLDYHCAPAPTPCGDMQRGVSDGRT